MVTTLGENNFGVYKKMTLAGWRICLCQKLPSSSDLVSQRAAETGIEIR